MSKEPYLSHGVQTLVSASYSPATPFSPAISRSNVGPTPNNIGGGFSISPLSTISIFLQLLNYMSIIPPARAAQESHKEKIQNIEIPILGF